jgi:hypothetical protein
MRSMYPVLPEQFQDPLGSLCRRSSVLRRTRRNRFPQAGHATTYVGRDRLAPRSVGVRGADGAAGATEMGPALANSTTYLGMNGCVVAVTD